MICTTCCSGNHRSAAASAAVTGVQEDHAPEMAIHGTGFVDQTPALVLRPADLLPSLPLLELTPLCRDSLRNWPRGGGRWQLLLHDSPEVQEIIKKEIPSRRGCIVRSLSHVFLLLNDTGATRHGAGDAGEKRTRARPAGSLRSIYCGDSGRTSFVIDSIKQACLGGDRQVGRERRASRRSMLGESQEEEEEW